MNGNLQTFPNPTDNAIHDIRNSHPFPHESRLLSLSLSTSEGVVSRTCMYHTNEKKTHLMRQKKKFIPQTSTFSLPDWQWGMGRQVFSDKIIDSKYRFNPARFDNVPHWSSIIQTRSVAGCKFFYWIFLSSLWIEVKMIQHFFYTMRNLKIQFRFIY